MSAIPLICLLAVGWAGSKAEKGAVGKADRSSAAPALRERSEPTGNVTVAAPNDAGAAFPSLFALEMPYAALPSADYWMQGFSSENVALQSDAVSPQMQAQKAAEAITAREIHLAKARIAAAIEITARPKPYKLKYPELEAKQKRFAQWAEYFRWVERNEKKRNGTVKGWTEFLAPPVATAHKNARNLQRVLPDRASALSWMFYKTDDNKRNPFITAWAEYPKTHPNEAPPIVEYKTPKFTDCGVFVSEIIRKQDPAFPVQGTEVIREYVYHYPRTDSLVWEHGDMTRSEPKPGDVLWRRGHVALYEGKKGKAYILHQASLSDHEPMKQRVDSLNFTEWFRLVRSPEKEEIDAAKVRLMSARKKTRRKRNVLTVASLKRRI